MAKLWGGRFEHETDKVMNDFHSSISFDSRMAKQDIMGSIAHAKMLKKQEIIDANDADAIVAGLSQMLIDCENGELIFSADAEDIHMNCETILTERIGEAGKRLHTGRSRNDQVALDLRLYMRDGIQLVQNKILSLLETIFTTAQSNLDTIMPGYTHLQKAQPITLAHHVMAYFEMFKRDYERLSDCAKRTNISPLGSGALATSTYPLDRVFVAEELGFDDVSQNSLDGVSDRDFCIEFAMDASMIMMHLSRFCEEIILWSSDEFRFATLDDAYSTGSSIMPQKKNPDVAELVRGKTGRVYGNAMALLSVMKSLPLAYNKDMQEDKEATFDALDTCVGCLDIFTKMFSTLRFQKDNMRLSAARGFTNATDAADYLVKKGLPFRSAHEVIGKMVLYCIQENKAIEDLSLEQLQAFSPMFTDDIYEMISLSTCVEDRSVIGGPAPSALQEHIDKAKLFLDNQN